MPFKSVFVFLCSYIWLYEVCLTRLYENNHGWKSDLDHNVEGDAAEGLVDCACRVKVVQTLNEVKTGVVVQTLNEVKTGKWCRH